MKKKLFERKYRIHFYINFEITNRDFNLFILINKYFEHLTRNAVYYTYLLFMQPGNRGAQLKPRGYNTMHYHTLFICIDGMILIHYGFVNTYYTWKTLEIRNKYLQILQPDS